MSKNKKVFSKNKNIFSQPFPQGAEQAWQKHIPHAFMTDYAKSDVAQAHSKAISACRQGHYALINAVRTPILHTILLRCT